MVPPSITLSYLAPLALIFSALSLVVVALRLRGNVPFGDGGDPRLLRAIRVHGNFAEWVPLAAILVGGLESLGAPAAAIHGLMGTLLVARVLHPIGLFSPLDSTPYRIGRIAGALSTWAVLTVSAVWLLTRL